MSGERLAGRELWGLALLTILWGFNWPVMKTGVSAIAPMTFRSLSMLLAVPMLWWMVRATGESIRIPRAHWREIALIALFNMAIWYVCVMYGVSLLSSGRAAILGYTMPIWAAVLGIVLYGERLGARLASGVLAAAGASRTDIVKVSVFLRDISDFATTIQRFGAECGLPRGERRGIVQGDRAEPAHVAVAQRAAAAKWEHQDGVIAAARVPIARFEQQCTREAR